MNIKLTVHFVLKKIDAFGINEKLLSMPVLWRNISIIGNFMILRSETPPLSSLAVGTSHPSALSRIIPQKVLSSRDIAVTVESNVATTGHPSLAKMYSRRCAGSGYIVKTVCSRFASCDRDAKIRAKWNS